jgi:hypothetical protein
VLAPIRTSLLALALVLTGALVSPGAADVRVIHDRAGDGSNGAGSGGPRTWGDLRTVRVDHAQKVLRITAAPPAGGMAADEYLFWLDVRGDRRPDAVAWVTFVTGPLASLHRTGGFGDLGGRRCQLRRPQYDVDQQSVRIVVPLRCLHPPGTSSDIRRLRVSAETAMEYEAADWAPRRRDYGPWVLWAGLDQRRLLTGRADRS